MYIHEIAFFWMPPHGMFLKCWNDTKSHPNIWQRFSSVLVEGIAKICQKWKSYNGLLSKCKLGRTIQPIQMQIFALSCSARKKQSIKFLCTFMKSLHQLDFDVAKTFCDIPPIQKHTVKTRSMRTTTNCYLVSLAVADTITLIVSVPQEVISYHILGDRWVWGSVGCTLMIYLQVRKKQYDLSYLILYVLPNFIT